MLTEQEQRTEAEQRLREWQREFRLRQVRACLWLVLCALTLGVIAILGRAWPGH